MAIKSIGILGVGVMGEALLAGLIKSGIAPSDIKFAEKREERASEIIDKYGISLASLDAIAAQSDVILLVVKPQDLGTLLDDIGSAIKSGTLLISFAAGKTTAFIEGKVPSGASVIRVMPNTPALIGKGAAAISEGSSVSAEQIAFVEKFLNATGAVVTVPESLQDAVTAVSGSGPAYFFAFVEAMIASGVELGLSEEVATSLTVQTIIGAAGMLEETGKSATTLRENVTSPNGTTFAALQSFAQGGLEDLVKKSMKAARDRSQELA